MGANDTRLIIIYSIIDLLLEGFDYVGGGMCEPGKAFNQAPLPCVRDLWQASTTGAWIRYYDDYLSKKKNHAILSVKDLLESSEEVCSTFVIRKDVAQGILMDIVQWSEALDALGTLVYMVIPLQQHRLNNREWEVS